MDVDKPEPADGIALLRAHLAGDEETVERILLLVDEQILFPLTVGLLVQIIERAGVSTEELDRALANWQVGQLG